MIRRPLTFALLPFALSAQLGTAHAQPVRPATTQPVPAAPAPAPMLPENPVEARETRDQLMEVLRQYPPSLAEVLRLDPSLLTSEQYIATYPGLAAFVARHPEVARNPAYFFGTEHVRSWEDYGPRAEAVRVWRNVIEGAQIFSIFAFVTGSIIWLVKMLVDHRRWLRQSKVQTEVHTKLMDRFTSNDDLLAYIQSPAGKRFLESAPIALEPDVHASQRRRALWPHLLVRSGRGGAAAQRPRACSLSASASSGKKSVSRCPRWASSSSPSAWAS